MFGEQWVESWRHLWVSRSRSKAKHGRRSALLQYRLCNVLVSHVHFCHGSLETVQVQMCDFAEQQSAVRRKERRRCQVAAKCGSAAGRGRESERGGVSLDGSAVDTLPRPSLPHSSTPFLFTASSEYN